MYIDVCRAILDTVDDYNSFCVNLINHWSRVELNNNLHNERTVAHYFDVALQAKCGFPKLISECMIPNALSSMERRRLSGEIECNSKGYNRAVSHNPRYYVPDTVIISDIKKGLVFIEYKVDNRFTYYKLAIDYLKYRCYASTMTCDTALIYVLFYKDGDELHVEYEPQIINDIPLTHKHSYDSKSVFIFESSKKLVLETDTHHFSSIIDRAEKQVNELANLLPFSDDERIKDNFFYSLRNEFKPQVITAKRIQLNYQLILEMDKRIRQKEYNLDLDYIEPSTESYSFNFEAYRENEFSEQTCEEMIRHFNAQIASFLKEDRSAIPDLYTIYNKRSLWILIMLSKFARDCGWYDLMKEFSFNATKTTIDSYVELLDENYQYHAGAFIKLCLGIIYYITHLYPLVFYIEDGIVIAEKNFFAYDRTAQSLNKSTRAILKELGYRRRKFDINNLDSQINFAKCALGNEV